MKNRWKVSCALVASSILLLLAGCERKIPLIAEPEENLGYTKQQSMVVVATEKNRYESVYGEELWSVSLDSEDMTFETYLLTEVRSFLLDLKMMNLLAEQEEITLTSEEQVKIQELAHSYYGKLSSEDITYMEVEEDDIVTLYQEYHLANKLVEELTKNIELEISDSEAKVIVVQEIVVEDETTAKEVYEQLQEEGASFSEIGEANSVESIKEKQVGRGERSDDFESAVFLLQTDEISEIVEEDGRYSIVKVIDDYDEKTTLERKEVLAKQRKTQAFNQIYDAFVADCEIIEDETMWEEITFLGNDKSTTTNFFEHYQENMNP